MQTKTGARKSNKFPRTMNARVHVLLQGKIVSLPRHEASEAVRKGGIYICREAVRARARGDEAGYTAAIERSGAWGANK